MNLKPCFDAREKFRVCKKLVYENITIQSILFYTTRFQLISSLIHHNWIFENSSQRFIAIIFINEKFFSPVETRLY